MRVGQATVCLFSALAPAHQRVFLVHSSKPARPAGWTGEKRKTPQGEKFHQKQLLHLHFVKLTPFRTTLFSDFKIQVAPKIKAMMMECGTTMVGYQPQGNKVNFFRMVVSNPAATRSDIDFLIDEIERLGQDLQTAYGVENLVRKNILDYCTSLTFQNTKWNAVE